MNSFPIGIFDSGLGGLSVWREVRRLLPTENIIYYADSKHCPYGHKSANEIIDLTRNISQLLINEFNCKLIVVACNTATAAAIDTLRAEFNVPFVGMEPAIKQAALHTKTSCVGVLATKGTFDGRLYKATSQKYAKNINIEVQIGDGLVELVESNKIETDEATKLLKKYIQPMVEHGADQIVLGCTHYPFFKTQIEKIAGSAVNVIDPAPAVAKHIGEVLKENNLQTDNQIGSDLFLSSSSTNAMKLLLENVLKIKVDDIEIVKNGEKTNAIRRKTTE